MRRVVGAERRREGVLWGQALLLCIVAVVYAVPARTFVGKRHARYHRAPMAQQPASARSHEADCRSWYQRGPATREQDFAAVHVPAGPPHLQHSFFVVTPAPELLPARALFQSPTSKQRMPRLTPLQVTAPLPAVTPPWLVAHRADCQTRAAPPVNKTLAMSH